MLALLSCVCFAVLELGGLFSKAFAVLWSALGHAGEWAWVEHGGPRLLAWLGVSGCSNCIFLIEFRESQYCNAWDSTACSCVTFCSQISSAQLRARSDPAAAERSWHAASCICRDES